MSPLLAISMTLTVFYLTSKSCCNCSFCSTRRRLSSVSSLTSYFKWAISEFNTAICESFILYTVSKLVPEVNMGLEVA